MPAPRTQVLVVAIDGPAGAGKSTVARHVAQHLGLALLDTGALYRAVALAALDAGVGLGDEAGLSALAGQVQIDWSDDPSAPAGAQAGAAAAPGAAPRAGPAPLRRRLLLGGRDVTTEIRSERVSDAASRVSQHAGVRAALMGLQRAAAAHGCVAEGRDMGTVVFPDAPVKVFLTASIASRARRRWRELPDAERARSSLEALEQAMRERDQRDSARDAAPLRPAADAAVVDTSDLALDDVVARVLEQVRDAASRRAPPAPNADDGGPTHGPAGGETPP